jgi:hypothetical protein
MATKKKETVEETKVEEEVESEKYQGGEIPRVEPKVKDRPPGSNEEAASYSSE